MTSLKKIKDQIMVRFFNKNKEVDEMCGTICPKIRKKLDKNIDFANIDNQLPLVEICQSVANISYIAFERETSIHFHSHITSVLIYLATATYTITTTRQIIAANTLLPMTSS